MMNRRQFLASSSATALIALFRETPLWAQPPAATSFQALRRNVGTFTGQGGTIGWLATPDGVIVVDSQYPATAQACIDGLKQRSARAIDLLINTHHHGDHTAGNITFQPVAGKIVAHANSATWQRTAAKEANTEAEQAYPTDTFTDTWSTSLGGETIALKYYGPGHTSGDAVVTFQQANVVHMGDLMFSKVHPFIDRPAGASIANWITILSTVPADHDADTVYIFGHAGPGLSVTGSREELAALRNYLSAALDFTRKQIQSGRSKEEVAETASLAGFEDYASPIPLLSLGGVLGVAYDELSAR